MTGPQRKLQFSPHSTNDIDQVLEGDTKTKKKEKGMREIAETVKYPTTWNIIIFS